MRRLLFLCVKKWFRSSTPEVSYTKAKNATVADYRKATGLEALMGYLYLKEDTKRIIELIKTGLDMAESQKKKGQEQA